MARLRMGIGMWKNSATQEPSSPSLLHQNQLQQQPFLATFLLDKAFFLDFFFLELTASSATAEAAGATDSVTPAGWEPVTAAISSSVKGRPWASFW
eukprot:CAMPEP_0206455360 /NCGR_PEP_ID=MMETSP0324_2-20121206/21702_1 /ASSEMBLY_ACC=CAM_ASM_000836 /TAXON_ID=2866 /ORGANISM="Crypthecodinium cohnii, Strain Seligo" /LENGTH=95 /DNA_ID=CAMNT_0053926041 /DNA_START=345 /DNA_END=629 /DNA_ORIENTATION=+